MAVTTNSVGLHWKLRVEGSMSNTISNPKISGFSVHYKPRHGSSWKEVSVPIGLNREEGEYLLDHLEPNTMYNVYVTGITNYGHGDPSPMIEVKTRAFGGEGGSGSGSSGTLFSSSENLNLMAFQQDMISVISITAAVVVVIVVIIIAFVCVRKAQIQGSKPPIDICAATLPRLLEADKSGAYIGATLRYVDFDGKPLMTGNPEVMMAGNVPVGYHPAAYSTMPLRDDLKKPWQRPLPDPTAESTTKRKSVIDTQNLYDFPQN
jgi:hypothetical protein